MNWIVTPDPPEFSFAGIAKYCLNCDLCIWYCQGKTSCGQ